MQTVWNFIKKKKDSKKTSLKSEDDTLKRSRFLDKFFMIVLILVYSLVSFWNLGDFEAPQTFETVERGEKIIISLPGKQYVKSVVFYTGSTQNDYDIEYTYTTEDYNKNKDDSLIKHPFNVAGPFKWIFIDVNRTISTFVIYNNSRTIQYGEVGAIDRYGNLISDFSVSTGQEYNLLADEQNLIPSTDTYMNSTYFDEIYFAQTAYQYANKMSGYETVHPPLGKIIQSIPIKLSGKMTPFTWRMMGTIAGILIIIAMYYLAYEIFDNKSYARLAAILTALSGLHFVQTRLGTIDSYLCLFTILSYLFMIKYLHSSKKKWLFLLSGVFFGCAFATKWSGAFGGFGLALMYLYHFIKEKIYIRPFASIVSFIGGVFCFVLVPFVIYFSSYLIFPETTNATTGADVISQGEFLFEYHSNEFTPHPYSSPWFSWPISFKPMLYYMKSNSSIWLTENMAISYISIIGLLITTYFCIKKRDPKSIIILVAWLSLFIPYAFIGRTMFLYHYLPASCFAILAIVNMFYQIKEIRRFLKAYIIITLITFVICYPSMTGI